MLNFSRWSIAWSVAVLGLSLSAPSFGWSISGHVKSSKGTPLGGVTIGTYDSSGKTWMTDDSGAFSFDENTTAIHGQAYSAMSVSFSNDILSLENVNAKILKVSMMDALGKVLYQRTFQHIFGFVSFDLSKYSACGAKFVRVNADGVNSSYMLMDGAALRKEGDPLPTFRFTKEDYAVAIHRMTQEDETGVEIVMNEVSNNPDNSSSSQVFNIPSSSGTSSYTVPDVPTDCSGKTLKSSTTLYVDGRKVIVKFPNGYVGNKPVPMLVNYHYIGGSADGWQGMSQIAQKALGDGTINVFPQGENSPNLGPAWNVGFCCTDADDITFSRHFIKEITEKACVDPTRIYAAGFSMGGGMSNYVGCYMADVFAAAAPSAFDLDEKVTSKGLCNPVRPFPILNFRGTNDGTVPYQYSGQPSWDSGKPITWLGAKGNLSKWAEMDGCTGSPVDNGDGCEFYENCRGGAKVGLCTIKDGGHSEGDATKGWNFLKQFKLQ